MTQLGLLFLGALAAMMSAAGLFGRFEDRWTNVVLAFAGSVVWGVFGISSFDVIVHSTAYSRQSEPMLPLAYLGVGFAVVVGLFGIRLLLVAVGGEVEETGEEGMSL